MSGLQLLIPCGNPGEQLCQLFASTLALQLLTISKTVNFVKRVCKYMSKCHSYCLNLYYLRQESARYDGLGAGKDLRSSSQAEDGRSPFTMMLMMRSTYFRFFAVLVVLSLVLASLAGAQQNSSNRGRKFKMPPPTARIEVTVVRDVNGKPIENASVIFHPVQGEREKGNMELKTNEDGKAIIDVLPIGDTIRLQIIAKGFQTYGDDFKVDKAQLAIDIRMKRPGEQYSIYSAHPAKKETGRDGRFIAYDDGTVLDMKTNLMWADEANASIVTMHGANTFVGNYQAGGYTDWRMPTQDEMLGLYDPDKSISPGNGGKPLHIVTELIKIDEDCYHADLVKGTASAGILEVPIFCFRDGKSVKAIGGLYKVLPVRSAAPPEQPHSATDAKP